MTNSDNVIGVSVIFLDETTSTNTTAAEILFGEKPAEGTVICAGYQTQGRGQQGNVWASEKGRNLTFSIILYPDFIRPAEQFLLNKFVSLSLLDFFRKYLPAEVPVKIKWPNDIYAGDRKIAGILIENALMQERIQYSIIGIGMNINQEEFSDKIPNAVSLKQLAGKDFNLNYCLKDAFNCLNARYLLLKERSNRIDKDYSENLFRALIFSNFLVDGVQVKAKLIGIASDGQLILMFENGIRRKFFFKEVEYIL